MTEHYNCQECELKDQCFFDWLRSKADRIPPCRRDNYKPQTTQHDDKCEDASVTHGNGL